MARLQYNGLATGSAGSLTALTLGGSLTNSATSITFSAALTYANGTAVPTIAGSDYIPLSILDANGNVAEVVYLTAYTAAATTGTIARGKEGTTGVSHASGAKVVNGPTTTDVKALRGINIPAVAPSTLDDEFDDTTGNSGPANGLNARWSKRNMGTAGWSILDNSKAPGAFGFDIPTGQSADQALYQAAPAGDFRITARAQRVGSEGRQMWGLFVLDSSGNGVSVLVDDSNNDAGTYIRTVASWAQTGAPATVSWGTNYAWTAGVPVVFSLRKASGVYYAAATVGDLPANDFLYEVSYTPTAFTPAYVGFGRLHASASAAKICLDWFRKS